ncbi:MAG: hypothetical protein ACXQT4_04850 [Methanotrichaceae archaeon]
MILVEVDNQDMRAISTEVRNLPGTLFGSSGPLLRPFLTKLEELLPPEKRDRGLNYISSTLRAHVDAVLADEMKIQVKSEDRSVEITKAELEHVLGEKYPSFDHQNLNLSGLLFLQSGPALQTCTLNKLIRDHGVQIPGGRRTRRYVFHTTVVSVRADRTKIEIKFDLDRLPRLLDASASTGTSDSV